MTDYEAYKMYCALKRHFQSDTYDYFKYNGKVRASYASFEKRSDRYFFTKLAKHKDIEGFLVANLSGGDKWVGDLVNEQAAEKQYMEWLKRKQSLSYTFKNDIDKVEEVKDMSVVDGQHPKLFKRYLSKDICAETIIIVNKIQHGYMFKYWDSKLSDPVWRQEKVKLEKLTPFLQYEEYKYRSILVDRKLAV